jgi:isocitrate dehydrogenase
MSHNLIPIAVAEGDGIGPEIMGATLQILKEAGAKLEYHPVEIGEKVYLRGQPAGIDPGTWEVLRHTKAFLKAPITTPQGGGFKSLNVTVRTSLGLYANVRPCVAYYPFVETRYPGMDVVIIRENEEDLYTGIEYRLSQDVYHAMKVITRTGCERIVRYAFEYAVANNRKKVTCFSKDNILKLTDGTFHKVFDEISKEYPSIVPEHWIVDIGAAKLADTPTNFDVIVMANLYGDILSDVAAQIAGSVGLAGSANIGQFGAMFEAIHGSAPRRAGQNLANPSGLLLAAIMMLNHLGDFDTATRIHNAWLKTIEDGIHTYDIFKENTSKQKVGTKEFAAAVVRHLGQLPQKLKPAVHANAQHKHKAVIKASDEQKELTGVDVFVEWGKGLDELRQGLEAAAEGLKLVMIGNRGVKVWPNTMAETNTVDLWRCRFESKEKEKTIKHQQVAELLTRLAKQGFDFASIENLYHYDGKPFYTVSQDQQ